MSGETGEGPSIPPAEEVLRSEKDSQEAVPTTEPQPGNVDKAGPELTKIPADQWAHRQMPTSDEKFGHKYYERARASLDKGDTFVDEETTVLKTGEIERAAKEQWSDITLPEGTVLALTVTEKTGEGEEQEKPLGPLRLGSDLRVGIGSFGWESGGYGNAGFTPSSDNEGEVRRQAAAVHKKSEPLRVKDIIEGKELSEAEEAELERLDAEVARLNKQVGVASEESRRKFVEERAELLKAHGVDPEKVTDVRLTAQIYEWGLETPPRLNRELHEPPPVEENVGARVSAVLEQALREIDEAKQGLENAAASTIEDAVNGLRFDKYGKEEQLTPEQVQDVYEAFAKASAAHLSTEARQAIIKELAKVPDGHVPFSPRPELSTKNIVKQGG